MEVYTAQTRYEFEGLAYLEQEGKGNYSIREISDNLCVSGTSVMKCIDILNGAGLICKDGEESSITEKGLKPWNLI